MPNREHDFWHGVLTPVVVCHPTMVQAATIIAAEFCESYPCYAYQTECMQHRHAVFLVDPYGRIDPALVAYVMDKYSVGTSWTPEASL